MKIYRLAIIRQKYRPDGGSERFASQMISILKTQNLNLNIITRKWKNIINSNCNIHLCNPFIFSRINREKGFSKKAKLICKKEKFDLIQSHERISGCDIYRAGDGVHRRWLIQRARIMSKWKRKLLFLSNYHRYIINAEHKMYSSPKLKAIICNSKMIKQEIIDDFNIPSEKISIIYNTIDHKKFIPSNTIQRNILRKKFLIPEKAHCLIFVGSGFERKGLSATIQAVSKTDSYLLVIGKDKSEKCYHDLAKSLGCIHRIRFMGIQKKILPFYQISDALILPTLYDPFPNVIIEALSCGLPVITSTTCGGSEFIISNKNGFIIDALNISEISSAILSLPRKILESKMSKEARLCILFYTPSYLLKKLFSLYNRLIK
ncbi:Glycosyl transferase group 1 family protein [Serratia symbiotica]|nr:Glycosyl transferase group 1 family protein [Serratia symbiotica]